MKLVKVLEHARSHGFTKEQIERAKAGKHPKHPHVTLKMFCSRCVKRVHLDEESLMDEATRAVVCGDCATAIEGTN